MHSITQLTGFVLSFVSFLVLLCLVVWIYLQRVTSPRAKSTKLNLLIFVFLLSISMITEATRHFFEDLGVEVYGVWSTKFVYSLTFIAVIFFFNVISGSVGEHHVRGVKEWFKHKLRKPTVILILQAFASTMALVTFLPSAMPQEGISLWYHLLYIVFAVSTLIVLTIYFRKALSISNHKQTTFTIWAGGITLIGFQFFHSHIESLVETYLITLGEISPFAIAYGGVSVVVSMIVISSVAAGMLLRGFREKTTLERFVLPTPTIEGPIGYEEDAFSSTLGFDHWQMTGRKILFEFDPTSDYEKVIQDFVAEALANGEPVAVFTRRGSSLHSFLSEQEAVKLFCLTQQVSVPKELSEKEMLLPSNNTSLMLSVFDKILKAHSEGTINIVFDNLSDVVLSIGFEKTYHFMRYMIEMLASPRITALILVNKIAHDPKVASSLKGLFSNQISFGKDGIQTVKLPEREAGTAEIEKISAKTWG